MGYLVALGAAFFLVALIIFVLVVVMYVFLSLGLYRLAVKNNIENPWIAWVPVVQYYIVGKLIKEVKVGDLHVPNAEIAMPVAWALFYVFSKLGTFGGILQLVCVVFMCFGFYKLFTMYRPKEALAWTIVTGITFTWLGGIFIFIMRDNEPVNPVNLN